MSYTHAMSFKRWVIEDLPETLWMFEGASPFIDHSGHGRVATSTATGRHAALVKGEVSSLIVDDTHRVTYDAPIMRQGQERQEFSIEAAFRPIRKDPDDTAVQQVFGNDGEYDGLCVSGTVVSFSTHYTATGEATCSFDLQDNRAVRAFAVHTPAKNALYIDDDLVAEVDITPEQQEDTYAYPGTTLTGGASTSDNTIALGAVATYRQALPDDRIDSHFNEAVDNMSEYDVGMAFGGAVLGLSTATANPYETVTFFDDPDWSRGQHNGTAVDMGQLVAQYRSGESLASHWTVAIPLPQDMGNLYGVTLNWQGQGVTVSTSLDSTSWTTATRAKKISTIPANFNPTEKVLYVRAAFAGGSDVDDESYIDDLTAAIYVSNTLPPIDGRTVTLSNASVESDEDIMDFDDNWGIELSNGTLTIGAPATGSMDVQTIEVWAKKSGAAVFSDNLSPSQSYTNGDTLQSYQIDEWQLRTYTFNAAVTSSIVFSGTGQIGCVVLYPFKKTPTEVFTTYLSYVGRPHMTLGETGNIGVDDIPDKVDAYEYDWAMNTAG